jgi:hypothetical protein
VSVVVAIVLAGVAESSAAPLPTLKSGVFGRSAIPTHPLVVGGGVAAAGVRPRGVVDGSRALVRNFNGVSSRDSAVTNFGAEFEPPDQGLCVGNGFVLEPVNSAYRVYRTDGRTVAGPQNVNALFGDGFRQFTSDPRCHYDATTHTWFAAILFINTTSTRSRLDIAVNHSGDPTTPWTHFRVDTTDAGGHGCPCFGDQPLLGIDAHNLYVSTNEFSIKGPQFNGTQLYAIDKHDLLHGRHNVRFAHIGRLRVDGRLVGSVQPAITDGPSDAEYLMGSLDPKGDGDHRIAVWALTHRGAVDRGGPPRLSKVIVRSERYAVPPPTTQRGSRKTLDSGDDRLQQVQYIGGQLWGELGTAVASGDGPVAGAAWFEVRPHLHGSSTIRGASITRQGYVASNPDAVIYPAVQADADGNAAMVFTISGPDRFPSAAFATLDNNATQFGPIVIAATGHGPYFRKSTRWGDYSWAVLQPETHSVWLATEYIPPYASQTVDGHQNWGTRVMEVRLPR